MCTSSCCSRIGEVDRHWFLQYDAHEIQWWNTLLMQDARRLDRIKLTTSSISIYLKTAKSLFV
jgi:hypothetical protein